MSRCAKCGCQVESPFDGKTVIHGVTRCGSFAAPTGSVTFDEQTVDAAMKRVRSTQVTDPTGRYQYPDASDVLAGEVDRLRRVIETQQWRITNLQQDMSTIIQLVPSHHQVRQIARRALSPNKDLSGGATTPALPKTP